MIIFLNGKWNVFNHFFVFLPFFWDYQMVGQCCSGYFSIKELEVGSDLANSLKGIERETLRITVNKENGTTISDVPHSQSLGAPLTHKYLKLDFAEALEEIVTPPTTSNHDLLDFLTAAHKVILEAHSEEFLWPFSSPPKIPDTEIPVADFGKSFPALFRHKYREDLACRYDAYQCQLLAGIHFNFSLPISVLQRIANQQSISTFEARNNVYFNAYRNVQLYSWIVILLTGNSQFLHETYFKDPSEMKTLDFESACSLRNSYVGYKNPPAPQLSKPVNTLSEYCEMLRVACSTPYRDFQCCKNVLSNNLIQVPAEFYGSIRPKSLACFSSDPIQAEVDSWNTPYLLEKGGINYLELRCVDVQYNSAIGVTLELLDFLEVFMLFCCFRPCQNLTQTDVDQAAEFTDDVSLSGRKLFHDNVEMPLVYQRICNCRATMNCCLNYFFSREFLPIAEILDENLQEKHYVASITHYLDRLSPTKLISAELANNCNGSVDGFLEFGQALARKYKSLITQADVKESFINQIKDDVARSIAELQALEARDADSSQFCDYVGRIMSAVTL
ncbi:hypothetical protein RCL1_002066 [Eukaryota sp. TZLM3-RCL]